MHDTVAKTRRYLIKEGLVSGVAPMLSKTLQDAAVSRAIAEPLSKNFEHVYEESHRWLKFAAHLTDTSDEAGDTFRSMSFASRHLYGYLEDLVTFLERAEDHLEERDDITHRESPYEREVAPFSRVASTEPFRDALEKKFGFDAEVASDAARIEGDLLKVIYLVRRLGKTPATAADVLGMVQELNLDARRHLLPNLKTGSKVLEAMDKVSS
ncbi:MAG: hypothetical protein HKN21_08760 [Candidatus Eisenbacteria bacterium]|uniref:Uncharacterized protein n=1 Tax=Eiseniibacteriota bacterium TaxID=2212470 RepID=A0A7Y2E7V9_UNCEI|nr:hypothetical protein [Candidatus Eisenbacteria bacterium]